MLDSCLNNPADLKGTALTPLTHPSNTTTQHINTTPPLSSQHTLYHHTPLTLPLTNKPADRAHPRVFLRRRRLPLEQQRPRFGPTTERLRRADRGRGAASMGRRLSGRVHRAESKGARE